MSLTFQSIFLIFVRHKLEVRRQKNMIESEVKSFVIIDLFNFFIMTNSHGMTNLQFLVYSLAFSVQKLYFNFIFVMIFCAFS